MTDKSYVGDTGTVLTFDCGQDISAATARYIAVKKPDRIQTTWEAEASGTDSIAFTTLADSLDQAGTWLLQPIVSIDGGTWRGETVQLVVYATFK